jgi:hypothetical protein
MQTISNSKIKQIANDKVNLQSKINKIDSELSQTLLNRGSIPRRMANAISQATQSVFTFGVFFGAPATSLTPEWQSILGTGLPTGLNITSQAMNEALNLNFASEERKILLQLEKYRNTVQELLFKDLNAPEGEKILNVLQRDLLQDFQERSGTLYRNILGLNDSTFPNAKSIMKDMNTIATIISRHVPEEFKSTFLPDNFLKTDDEIRIREAQINHNHERLYPQYRDIFPRNLDITTISGIENIQMSRIGNSPSLSTISEKVSKDKGKNLPLPIQTTSL